MSHEIIFDDSVPTHHHCSTALRAVNDHFDICLTHFEIFAFSF